MNENAKLEPYTSVHIPLHMSLLHTLIRIFCLQLAARPLADRLTHDASLRDVQLSVDQAIHEVARALERNTQMAVSTASIQLHVRILESQGLDMCVHSLENYFSEQPQ